MGDVGEIREKNRGRSKLLNLFANAREQEDLGAIRERVQGLGARV